MKKKTKIKTKKKTPSKKPVKKKNEKLRQSKTENFLETIRNNNSMVDYFTRLRILNPAAQLTNQLNEPRREGGFVRLAHAREEFTAPVLTKGKSVIPPSAKKTRKKK